MIGLSNLKAHFQRLADGVRSMVGRGEDVGVRGDEVVESEPLERGGAPKEPPLPPLSPDAPRIAVLDGCFAGGIASIVRRNGGAAASLTMRDADRSNPLQGFDGLVIPGGADVNPEFYGEENTKSSCLPKDVDEFQIGVIQMALGMGMPIFGICRGEQLLNVAAKGSLWQDYASDLKVPHHPGTHEIRIEPGSRLEQLWGTARRWVNSMHHQAVKAIAPGFVAVAFGPGGVIEAIENEVNRTQFGVQFHPECMQEMEPARRLFEAHVADAKAFKESRRASAAEGVPKPVPA